MRHRWPALVLAAASLVVCAPSHQSWKPALRATGTGSTLTNPATNIPPSPDYWPTCSQDGAASQQCTDAVVTAINNARAQEGVGPMTLPADFGTLTTAQQTFVVSNLERVDRGLAPAAGMVDSLSSLAETAATNDADPVLPGWSVDSFSVNMWGSNWAGDLNALAADYDWMYNDGWGPTGSYNLDCQSATGSGCWGHRDNILMPDSGEEVITGVGSTVQSQWTSIAQMFVLGSGSYPAFTLSWADVTGTPLPAPVAPQPPPAPPAPDATSVSLTVPTTIVGGQTARITARLYDVTAAAPAAGVPVSFCHHTATSATTCTATTTSSTGVAVLSARPAVATAYWLVFAGTSTLAPVSSGHAVVHVRPAVSLRSGHISTGWRVVAHLTPARGQTVLLRRHTATGWVTVRRARAGTTMTFTRLRTGSYRLVVGAVSGSLSASASVHVG